MFEISILVTTREAGLVEMNLRDNLGKRDPCIIAKGIM